MHNCELSTLKKQSCHWRQIICGCVCFILAIVCFVVSSTGCVCSLRPYLNTDHLPVATNRSTVVAGVVEFCGSPPHNVMYVLCALPVPLCILAAIFGFRFCVKSAQRTDLKVFVILVAGLFPLHLMAVALLLLLFYAVWKISPHCFDSWCKRDTKNSSENHELLVTPDNFPTWPTPV